MVEPIRIGLSRVSRLRAAARIPVARAAVGPALTAVVCVAAAGVLAPPASAAQGDPLSYFGGPVAHSMTGVFVEWGPDVNPLFTNTTTGDPGLIKYFASLSGSPGDNGGVLAQYMDSSGANAANDESYGGEYEIAPTVTGSTLQDSQVAAQLVTEIEAGALPAPAGNGLSTAYIVLFPPGMSVCDDEGCSGQAFCSYHASTELPNGTPVLYLVIPDDTTGSMTQGCGSSTPLRNQTMYLSHEWAETISDPLVDDATSLAPPLAWYDPNCPTASAACGEVADKCNQQTTLEGGWTVQLLWSNLDGACVGTEDRYGEPSVAFTPPPGVSPGQAATFTASAADPPGNTASASFNSQPLSIPAGIASVTWSWGDGTPAGSGAQAVHTFANPGLYTVSVSVTDNLGFTASATATVGVWGPLGPPVASTGKAKVQPTAATLSGSIDPASLAVGYRFDYGAAPSQLTSSTAVLPVAAGASAKAISTRLTGLRPATTYYYRLDVVLGSQVLPGAVESLRTTQPARSGAPLATVASAKPKTHSSRRRRRRSKPRTRPRKVAGAGTRTVSVQVALDSAKDIAAVVPIHVAQTRADTATDRLLRDGLPVFYTCHGPCGRVELQATLALRGALGAVALPRVLASEVVSSRAQSGRARLRFSSGVRGWLLRLRSASFAVSGYAARAR